MFVDAVMTSGATAHLAFCPVAGVSVERARVHAHGHTLFLYLPIWEGLDSPGRLLHLQADRIVLDERGARDEPCVLAGFYGEYVAFLAALAAGTAPSPSLGEARQSVEVAECLRRRAPEFQA
jgi:hypothetical protein